MPQATPVVYRDAEIQRHYHRMDHQPRPCDIGIGLGGHDLAVATYAADLYQQGMYPLLLFTGANAPSTIQAFPRGEAVHFREEALARGVPSQHVLVEPDARDTGQNIGLSRKLLADKGIKVTSAVLISKPSQVRRTYTAARKLWPELDVISVSAPADFRDYITRIGEQRLIEFLVGDLSRIIAYPKYGYAIEQDVPPEVRGAYQRLIAAGYTARLLK